MKTRFPNVPFQFDLHRYSEADGLRFGNSIVEVKFDESHTPKTFTQEKGGAVQAESGWPVVARKPPGFNP